MATAGPPTQIFCRLCGRMMAPASRCPGCGWVDRIGLLAEASFTPPARPSAPVPLALPARPPASAPTTTPEARPLGSLIAPTFTDSLSTSGATGNTQSVPAPSLAVPPTEAGPKKEPSLTAPIRPSGSPRPPSPRAPSPSGAARVPHSAAAARSPATAQRARTLSPRAWLKALWKRHLPPVRLVWVFLAILLWNGQGLRNFATAQPLLLLPLVAVLADLGLQAVRFPRVRVPDAAIANGLFLSVILWPTQISLALVAVAVVTVGLRHAARVASHPIFNPAAAGVLIAATVFALPQPWHIGITRWDTLLVAVLGLVLWSKAWPTWRIWGTYFACNLIVVVAVADLLGGSKAVPLVLQTSLLGTTPVFFGLFMVTEPRTAPTARVAMLVFGSLVGASAALLPVLFAEYTAISALGVLAPYLALFVGNVFTVALPSARGIRRPATAPVPTPAPRRPAGAGSGPS
ncbi:MAG: hypothetical protein L3J95_03090 [Thermoplasmata archaeon]|nr:hypothetical protein [Thermoplasmata archaeon]MCI4359392.1 hypothetical protein [Thermoplasmata archaeon]